MHSYSGLVRGHGIELPDHDAWLSGEAVEESETRRHDIFTFPRGARAGQCLHTIMERLSFDADRDRISSEVAAGLRQYGFEDEWNDVVTDTVERVLATPLEGPDLKLSAIGVSVVVGAVG